MHSGAELIATERQRQMDVEGWTAQHDACHDCGELCVAAAAYLKDANISALSKKFPSQYFGAPLIPYNWPWDVRWWKPSNDPIRNLVKAGALIAAEIDRIQSLNRNGDAR